MAPHSFGHGEGSLLEIAVRLKKWADQLSRCEIGLGVCFVAGGMDLLESLIPLFLTGKDTDQPRSLSIIFSTLFMRIIGGLCRRQGVDCPGP
jgi:hypothetical protein